MQRKVVVSAIAFAFFVGGLIMLSSDNVERNAAQARSSAADVVYAKKMLEYERVEAEAHHANVTWYEVKMNKYGGDCNTLDSPRNPVAFLDLWTARRGRTIAQAYSTDGNYYLEYTVFTPTVSYIFTTSREQCEEIIKKYAA